MGVTKLYCASVANADDKEAKAGERAARERFEQAVRDITDGSYRFASKVRGQAGLILEEIIDPEGDAVATLAEVEGDVGALALAMPLDLITFETWLLGQVGDADDLDLDIGAHRDHWFYFGSWIGETLRTRHGGHWLIAGPDPHTWRMGFSKILLETAPFVFAEALLRSGSGAAKRLVAEIERLRTLHSEQEERDGGPVDRFAPQHYVRMHTVPLGQWMAMDLALIERLWLRAATRDLIKQVRVHGKRLGAQNQPFLDKLVETLGKLDQDKPTGAQTGDRGLYEALAQIIALHKTSAPVAMDVLEKFVMPAVHMGVPTEFPPLDDDDIESLHKGIELFALFVDITPFRHQAEDGGFLGVLPAEDLSTPYRDRQGLEIGKGDWVVVNPRRLRPMLLDFDGKRMLAKYDEFVKYVGAHAKAPRRRDNGRFLAEAVVGGISELRSCIGAAGKDDCALLFRILPPPG
jgi:hypothetical protein